MQEYLFSSNTCVPQLCPDMYTKCLSLPCSGSAGPVFIYLHICLYIYSFGRLYISRMYTCVYYINAHTHMVNRFVLSVRASIAEKPISPPLFSVHPDCRIMGLIIDGCDFIDDYNERGSWFQFQCLGVMRGIIINLFDGCNYIEIWNIGNKLLMFKLSY